MNNVEIKKPKYKVGDILANVVVGQPFVVNRISYDFESDNICYHYKNGNFEIESNVTKCNFKKITLLEGVCEMAKGKINCMYDLNFKIIHKTHVFSLKRIINPDCHVYVRGE